MVVDPPEKYESWKKQNAVWEEKTRHIRDEITAVLEPAREAFYKDRLSRFPEEIQTVLTMQPQERNSYQWQMFHKAKTQVTFTEAEVAGKLKGEAKARYAELKKQLAEFEGIRPEAPSFAQVMIDEPRPAPKTFVLRGGAYDAPLDEVQPGFLTIVDNGKPAPVEDHHRRSVLANWIANADNPFTARVAVNRIWHHHFGRGIVGTPGDFGLMGERPTHPELLNWLASTFVEQGWSQKKLHKLIVLSRTYRQSSAANETALKADPENKLLWRFQRRRLEGEVIRDAVLATAGLLNPKMGGPGVFPPRPALSSSYKVWKVDEDPAEANRRSVYVFVRRNARYPLFESFDMPDTHESCSRRTQTVSVTQSLALLNDNMVLDWARGFAQRVKNDAGMPVEAQIERAFRLAFHRAPNERELVSAVSFLERQSKIASPDAALADLCHVLLNSNEFLYVD
jgi:hypothetical protein